MAEPAPTVGAACESWLRANGVPAFVRGHARPGSIVRRSWDIVGSGLLVVIVVGVGLLATGFFAFPHSWWVYVLAAVIALGLGYLLTAIGITAVVGFTFGWFLRIVWRTGSGMTHILPLLLVAVVFTFLSAETWQSIGRLKGLPLVLTTLLIAGLAVLLLRHRQGEEGASLTFADAAAVEAALPRSVRQAVQGAGEPADAPRASWVDPPGLSVGERINVQMISLLGRVLVAAVVGLAIAGFFVVFGVLTVDEAVAASWSTGEPTVWWQLTIAEHTYSLTAEHVRVAAFLGVFSALYFIVSAASDRALRETLSADTERHVRQCLAVRAVYRATAD